MKIRVQDFATGNILSDFEVDEAKNFGQNADRLGRDVLHYHGNFAFRLGDVEFPRQANVSEVKEFAAAAAEEEKFMDPVDSVEKTRSKNVFQLVMASA